MRGNTIRPALLLLAILATLAFIWGNSLDSAVESAAKSGRVRELLRPLLELVVGQGGVTDHLVRKLAHFTEYAVLGALLLLLTAVGFRVRLQTEVNCLFFLMAAALTDETIQIFPGRGPQLQDVWLDFAGGFPGPQTCGCLSYPYKQGCPARDIPVFYCLRRISGSFSEFHIPADTSAPRRPRPAAPAGSGCPAARGRRTRRPARASSRPAGRTPDRRG